VSGIHPTAIVDPKSEIAADVTVGPYAIIGPNVEIGPGCRIGAHSVIEGPTRLGRDNAVHPFASVGSAPQDLKYRGEPTVLEIGDSNVIREFATLNRGTAGGGGVTRVGAHNVFMAYAHVAHDCIIGDHVLMANAATLAGHVTIEDHAIVGGLVAIHQHARIGESAILGGGAMVTLDVPPYCMAAGDRAKLQGLNLVGLKRRGMTKETIDALRAAYRVLFAAGLRLGDALARLRSDFAAFPEVLHLADFCAASVRGITR
jgi:UDP-N-acetylglucosamine acyltransferase